MKDNSDFDFYLSFNLLAYFRNVKRCMLISRDNIYRSISLICNYTLWSIENSISIINMLDKLQGLINSA